LLGSRQPRISSENAAAFCLDPQILGRGGGIELETTLVYQLGKEVTDICNAKNVHMPGRKAKTITTYLLKMAKLQACGLYPAVVTGTGNSKKTSTLLNIKLKSG
jgi:hypothetical protein